MSDPWSSWVQRSYRDWKGAALARHLHPFGPGRNSVRVEINGTSLDAWLKEIPNDSIIPHEIPLNRAEELVLFSLNDYLGLSTHDKVRAAAAEAAQRGGMGPRSSAIVAGYTVEHR